MRLNFEFNDDQVRDLKELQEKAGATSMKDLFNIAMSLLEWTVDETIKGNEIVSTNDEDKYHRVLVMPNLQRVAKRYQLERA